MIAQCCERINATELFTLMINFMVGECYLNTKKEVQSPSWFKKFQQEQ